MIHTSKPQLDIYQPGVWRVPHLDGRIAISSNRRILFVWISDIISIQRTSFSTRLNVRNAENPQGYISLWLSVDPVEFIPVLGTAFPRIQEKTLVNIGMVESIGPYFIQMEHLGVVLVDAEYRDSFMKVVGFFGFTMSLKKSANLLRLPKRIQTENRIATYKFLHLRNALAV